MHVIGMYGWRIENSNTEIDKIDYSIGRKTNDSNNSRPEANRQASRGLHYIIVSTITSKLI